MIAPSWLSGSLRSFLYSSSVHSCCLFLISSASVRSIQFLSFIVPILAWNVPLISPVFLDRSLVFPILLFSSSPLHFSFKAFLSFLFILWNSASSWVYLSLSPLPFTSLFSSAICKVFSNNHFAFLHLFFLGMVLITASCTVLQTASHSSSGALSDLIPWTYSSPPLYNHKGFDLGLAEWPCGFPYFLQLGPKFCHMEVMIWATVSSRYCFYWLYRVSPSLAAKNNVSKLSQEEMDVQKLEHSRITGEITKSYTYLGILWQFCIK